MLMTTSEVLALLRRANPGTLITEDRVRHLIRRGVLNPPSLFGGRYAWTDAELTALAKALGYNSPSPDSSTNQSRPGSIATGEG